MREILLFILLGLGSGALIAGIALGVVLIYRGSGIINLATGGIAMLAGYAFWALRTDQLGIQMSTGPALVVSFAFVLVVGSLIDLVAFRPLRTAAPLAKLVSSLGVLLVAQAAMLLAFGTSNKPQPAVLPQRPVAMLGAAVPVDRFILTGIVIMLSIALAALYRWTRFGLATRAASENEVAAMLGGLSPNALSLTNTLIGSLVAGALGILDASITSRNPTTLPLQIVPALAAALIGGFTSFGIACAAGISIGVIDSLIGTLIALSLVAVTGFVGQISVVQLTLAGVCGFTVSHLAVNAGIGFPLAPLVGAVAAVVLGLLTAVSALRVRGVSLAVVTLAAVVAITNFGFLNSTWGGGQTGSPVPEPHLLGLDIGPRAPFRGLDGNLPSPVFGWVGLIVTVALCLLVAGVRRGILGQRMLAVRSNERAAAAVAINPRNV